MKPLSHPFFPSATVVFLSHASTKTNGSFSLVLWVCWPFLALFHHALELLKIMWDPSVETFTRPVLFDPCLRVDGCKRCGGAQSEAAAWSLSSPFGFPRSASTVWACHANCLLQTALWVETSSCRPHVVVCFLFRTQAVWEVLLQGCPLQTSPQRILKRGAGKGNLHWKQQILWVSSNPLLSLRICGGFCLIFVVRLFLC